MFYRNYKKLNLNLNLILILMVLGLVILSGQSMAAVNCADVTDQDQTDSDLDGLSDYLECNWIRLADGTLIQGNPDAKELFVIIIPSLPTAVDSSVVEQLTAPTDFINRQGSTGGLGIATPRIEENQAGTACPALQRCVTTTQSAVRVMENLDPVGNVIGAASYGTPNGLDGAVVYSARIKNFINSTCSGKSECKDYYTSLTGNELLKRYVQHTLSHEIGHTTALTSVYNDRFGGNHYKSGTGYVMDQSVFYTDKGGKVAFYITSAYTDTDRQTVRLK